jgi:glutamate carboxypeptidase
MTDAHAINRLARAGEQARAYLRERVPAMRDDLRALVEQSSFTDDRDGVNAALARLEDALPSRWTRERVSGGAYGDHLVIRGAHGPAGQGGVGLVGHMDTVFPREVFSGYREEGERARGPGVLDMKGGLIVTLYGLAAAEACGALEGLPWSWVVVADEEVGSPTSAEILRAEVRGAASALVFESGRAHDAIVTSRKGTGSVTVTAHGVAAHAGNAHDRGRNALWALARWIDRAQALSDPATGVTVNVGVVRGGTSKNTVPDRATAEVDVRYLRPDDLARLRLDFARAARECPVEGTRIELAWGPGRSPLVRTEEASALFARYARCQREAELGDGEHPLVGGGSDASTTSSAGVPSIDALGVRGEGFHTKNEYAELRTLAPKAEALARFLALAAAERHT